MLRESLHTGRWQMESFVLMEYMARWKWEEAGQMLYYDIATCKRMNNAMLAPWSRSRTYSLVDPRSRSYCLWAVTIASSIKNEAIDRMEQQTTTR
jgi:hypothetical protein